MADEQLPQHEFEAEDGHRYRIYPGESWMGQLPTSKEWVGGLRQRNINAAVWAECLRLAVRERERQRLDGELIRLLGLDAATIEREGLEPGPLILAAVEALTRPQLGPTVEVAQNLAATARCAFCPGEIPADLCRPIGAFPVCAGCAQRAAESSRQPAEAAELQKNEEIEGLRA